MIEDCDHPTDYEEGTACATCWQDLKAEIERVRTSSVQAANEHDDLLGNLAAADAEVERMREEHREQIKQLSDRIFALKGALERQNIATGLIPDVLAVLRDAGRIDR